MFQLVSDESSQNIGIGIHKKRRYHFETPLLKGVVQHDSTDKDFLLTVEPHYRKLIELSGVADQKLIWKHFDEARGQSLQIGVYKTLDVVDAAVTNLELWYRELLKREGAGQHFLGEGHNGYYLIKDDKAADIRYGDAIIKARTIQAFAMMRENRTLDFATTVGKVMPIFLQALGLKEYHLSHTKSEDGHQEARFIIDKVGIFSFHGNKNPYEPAFFERYSYRDGDYYRTFSGETKGDILKQFVFQWLTDAAQELETITRDDFDQYFNELASDIRRSWIKSTQDPNHKSVFEEPTMIKPISDDKVVSLAAFRPA